MPPVLIIHATEDPIASVESMRRLERKLRKLGGSPQVLLYPSEDHILEGDAWNEASGKIVAFFGKTLSSAP